jgi:hypothetical protein
MSGVSTGSHESETTSYQRLCERLAYLGTTVAADRLAAA